MFNSKLVKIDSNFSVILKPEFYPIKLYYRKMFLCFYTVPEHFGGIRTQLDVQKDRCWFCVTELFTNDVYLSLLKYNYPYRNIEKITRFNKMKGYMME